jgi:hypothetical protein
VSTSATRVCAESGRGVLDLTRPRYRLILRPGLTACPPDSGEAANSACWSEPDGALVDSNQNTARTVRLSECVSFQGVKCHSEKRIAENLTPQREAAESLRASAGGGRGRDDIGTYHFA